MFTSDEEQQILDRGSEIETVLNQLSRFKKGYNSIQLDRPATINDGILKIDQNELAQFVRQFDQYGGSIVKFVPASGAATRMFKDLYAFLKSEDENLTRESFPGVFKFFKNLESFSFYPDLKKAYKRMFNVSLEEDHVKKEYKKIIHVLLAEGLGYGSMPKGLLKFHRYDDVERTPIEEQIIEGKMIAPESSKLNYHFTVSPNHLRSFQDHITNSIVTDSSTNIAFSVQDPSSDTIAVDLSNQPVKVNSKLLFRPAGHGALLHNLNELNESIVFIKNIDNVLPDSKKDDTIQYKKALGGILLSYQSKVFRLLERHDLGDDIDLEAKKLLLELGIQGNFSSMEMVELLNRPMRVCGMVKNEGEPGGGPFWVRAEGTTSLQIVEGAQVDTSNEAQTAIFKKSTHFNPVDLVCGIRNYKNEKFDLLKYRDNETGFISEKSVEGRSIKAMELPGLWNGSMSNWNTIFVEVPLTTFSPVKTINDLLRSDHQS